MTNIVLTFKFNRVFSMVNFILLPLILYFAVIKLFAGGGSSCLFTNSGTIVTTISHFLPRNITFLDFCRLYSPLLFQKHSKYRIYYFYHFCHIYVKKYKNVPLCSFCWNKSFHSREQKFPPIGTKWRMPKNSSVFSIIMLFIAIKQRFSSCSERSLISNR